MFSSVLLAGLLASSTFASPVGLVASTVDTPESLNATLQRRADRKYCNAVVLDAKEPNDYCYQFCDDNVRRIIADKPVVVSDDSNCANGPEGGCPITILNQVAIERSTTETHGTTEVKSVNGGISLFGTTIGGGYQKWVESSEAKTEGETKTMASTNWHYVPLGKSGHVVFFPLYEEHCGTTTVLRKPNLYDDTNFGCNPDYNILINNDADLSRIRGMKYDWEGIKEDDIYNYNVESCIRLPMVKGDGSALGRYQVCDSDNTDNACKECVDCDVNNMS